VKQIAAILAGVVLLVLCNRLAAAPITVFSDDFDGGRWLAEGVSGDFSGINNTESVQGYSGLGHSGYVFSGSSLRNTTKLAPMQASPSVLTLSGLSSHTHIDLDFLLAIIDSWDGGGSPPYAPDRFNVTVDGLLVFSHTFSEVNNEVRPQSYVPPEGGLLAFNTPLGFSSVGGFNDSAYDMSLEPTLIVAHTAPSVSIQWYADGDGWQGGADESWAIENVRVRVESNVVPEPCTLLVWSGLGAAGLVAAWRRRRRQAA